MARLPDGWILKPINAHHGIQVEIQTSELITCKDCKHCFNEIYGTGNVVVNVCELTHNYTMPDDWYCADAERRENDA